MLYGPAAFVYKQARFWMQPFVFAPSVKTWEEVFFSTARKLEPALMNNLKRKLYLELVKAY